MKIWIEAVVLFFIIPVLLMGLKDFMVWIIGDKKKPFFSWYFYVMLPVFIATLYWLRNQ